MTIQKIPQSDKVFKRALSLEEKDTSTKYKNTPGDIKLEVSMGSSNHEGELLSQHVYLNTFIKYTYLEDAGIKTEQVIFDTI